MPHKEKVEFEALVLGFCSAALSYMGYGDEKAIKNISLAEQNIDIIALLKEKTKGNLTDSEQSLVDDALADLKAKLHEVRS